MKFKTKTSAYAFDEDLMKANGECSLSIQKSSFGNILFQKPKVV